MFDKTVRTFCQCHVWLILSILPQNSFYRILIISTKMYEWSATVTNGLRPKNLSIFFLDFLWLKLEPSLSTLRKTKRRQQFDGQGEEKVQWKFSNMWPSSWLSFLKWNWCVCLLANTDMSRNILYFLKWTVSQYSILCTSCVDCRSFYICM